MSTTPAHHVTPFLINDVSSIPFADRSEAGRVLAEILRDQFLEHPLLLALPRGGVPVACEIATALRFPLDVFLVRRFRLPDQPKEFSGIVASGAVHHFYYRAPLSPATEAALERERTALLRRETDYRQSRVPQPIAGRTVIVVDDGLTTGATMRDAILALRQLHPARIIAAVPVASPEVCAELATRADSVVCARTPHSFFSVRRCYTDFSPVLDSDIRNSLDKVDTAALPRAFHA